MGFFIFCVIPIIILTISDFNREQGSYQVNSAMMLREPGRSFILHQQKKIIRIHQEKLLVFIRVYSCSFVVYFLSGLFYLADFALFWNFSSLSIAQYFLAYPIFSLLLPWFHRCVGQDYVFAGHRLVSYVRMRWSCSV